MKRIAIIVCALIITLSISNSSLAQKSNNIKEVKISTAAHCGSCKAKIEKELSFEKGVKYINVDITTKVAHIKYRDDKTTEEKLLAAIQKLGYKNAAVIPADKTIPKKPLPKDHKGAICPSKTK